MLFNSLHFFIFFPLVTVSYFLLPFRFRWMLLLLASCYFYMALIPVYILVLFLAIVVDYSAGIFIEDAKDLKKKKWFLILSIISTCLILFVFKYYNFFIFNFNIFAEKVGWDYSLRMLEIILPVGLSFHTFQSLSYVLEVYKGRQKAERHLGIYSLYVMFYPQLVAGPIERPQNIIHQFYIEHRFEYSRVVNGLRLMLWGLFKKMVIADRVAPYVNQVFDHPSEYQGAVVVFASILFAIQIYCDFSGYSDIALGSARVMGFELMENFKKPYFSTSIKEFWSRWHISLSTWFRDYLYIPMGGNRVKLSRWYFNLFFTFLVSGFWHGANWTFIIWGALHGFYLIFGLLTDRFFLNPNPVINRWYSSAFPVNFLKWAFTFLLVVVAWVFFRAESLNDALLILNNATIWDGFGVNIQVDGYQNFRIELVVIFLITGLLLLVDFYSISKNIEYRLDTWRPGLRWITYFLVVEMILWLGIYGQKADFIYFQF